MKRTVLIGILLSMAFAVRAQNLPATAMIKETYKKSVPAVDSTMAQLGYEKPKQHVDGVYPVVYDMVKWDAKALKFPNRYEVSKWKGTTDSTFVIKFVTSDTVQFNKLLDEFVFEKFVRTPNGEKSINKDYTSVKYSNVVMRIEYNQLLNTGPNKIGVYYSWK